MSATPLLEYARLVDRVAQTAARLPEPARSNLLALLDGTTERARLLLQAASTVAGLVAGMQDTALASLLQPPLSPSVRSLASRVIDARGKLLDMVCAHDWTQEAMRATNDATRLYLEARTAFLAAVAREDA